MTIHTITLDPAVDILGNFHYAGGKGILTAKSLVSLGFKDVKAYAFVGGKTGEEFTNLTKEYGLDLISIPIQGETRTTKIISATPEKKESSPSPRINEVELLALRSTLEGLISPGDYVVFSGRVPPGLQTNVYGDLISLCNSKAAYSILDASQVNYAIPGIASRPYIFKGNEEEWSALNRTPESLLKEGITYCIKTKGKNGSELFSSSRRVIVTPPNVEIKSAVGSGDCLTAGFLYKVIEGKCLENILAFAVACGTVAAKNGAARCTLKEAEVMQKQVKVESNWS